MYDHFRVGYKRCVCVVNKYFQIKGGEHIKVCNKYFLIIKPLHYKVYY